MGNLLTGADHNWDGMKGVLLLLQVRYTKYKKVMIIGEREESFPIL